MKKLLFIAAIAGAALVSCTKNEVAQSVNEQKAISFATPIVGVTTKAPTYGLLTEHPTTQTFNVWGWYSEADEYVADETVKAYMTDVKVAYNSGNFNNAETENGAWAPTPTYFWPKNGQLTFDAYSPTEIQTGNNVKCDKATGLTIENYVVPNTLENQIDVLFSDRTYDNVSTSFTSGNTYEGVDIAFNHALSAIAFNVAQAGDYADGTLTIKSIAVDAFSKGTFTQNIQTDRTQSPAWTAAETLRYTILEKGNYAASQHLTTTLTAAGSTALMLPQVFSSSKAKVTIEYYIKNNDEDPLLQVYTFELNQEVNQSGEDSDGNTVTVNKWEMGKRYTYNITIGLQGIYFAPTVTGWTDVTVDLPQINN